MATNTPLQAIVAGGGIGGLALANGLRRAGVAVRVHEREVQRADRLQGFRIHVNPHGSAALHELLSPALFDAFVAASGKGGNGFGFVTEQFDRLVDFDATGIVTISGKYALTDAARDRLDPRLLTHPWSVIPPSGCGMFIAPHEFTAPAAVPAAEGLPPGLLFDDTRSYVFWAFAAKRERFGTDLTEFTPARLHATADRMTTGWAPELRHLVAESDPATTTLIPIKTSVPIPRWTTTNVTLLGDAIHSMTPFAGIGANTARRDAQLLCRMLISADRRERGLLAALDSYEAAMTDYGFAAVRTSLSTAERSVADGRLGRMMGKLVLRTAGAIPPMKRRMFADLGA